MIYVLVAQLASEKETQKRKGTTTRVDTTSTVTPSFFLYEAIPTRTKLVTSSYSCGVYDV